VMNLILSGHPKSTHTFSGTKDYDYNLLNEGT
jgi:hypothetical protein